MKRRIRTLGLVGMCLAMVLVIVAGVFGQMLKEPALDKIPKEYQDKHMPKGWWTGPNGIAEGKKIYEGRANPEVICAACHGRDGKPLLRGTRDLRDAEYWNKMTDSYMYWRVAEGLPMTAMTAWKDKLTEEQIWKVIAYSHTLAHGGKAEEHIHK